MRMVTKRNIRVTSEERSGNLHIDSTSCQHISGFFDWEDCLFKLKSNVKENGVSVDYVLRDEKSTFGSHCGGLQVSEDIKPVF